MFNALSPRSWSKSVAVAGLVLMGSVAAVPAMAVPIAAGSLISFSDGANYNSTSITFLNNGIANIPATTASGSFATAFGAGCVGCATFNSFTFSPFVSPTTVYTATLNGATTAFTLNTLTTVSTTAPFLDLRGTGTLTLTGFDPTPGQFFLSAQGPQGANVSFSATSIATAVPEPASLALLGAGLVGAGLIRRKRG